MTSKAFVDWPQKAVTLLGMSGIGKTHLANQLPKSNWFHYSGDYRIGTKYLAEPILDNIKRQAMQVDFLKDLLRSDSIYIANNITVYNLEPVSTFLGKIGRTDLGGLSLDEFKRRQALHFEAECSAMRDVAEFIDKAHEIYGYPHFLNDAGGSICELPPGPALDALTGHTLILYLKADDDMEQELIRRSISHPKPMFFGERFLDGKLAEYLQREGLESPDDIDPDTFSQWIFPELLEYRKPLYEEMAAQYAYTVDAKQIGNVHSEDDFISLITESIDRHSARAG